MSGHNKNFKASRETLCAKFAERHILSVATPTGQTFVVAELRSAVLAHLLNQMWMSKT